MMFTVATKQRSENDAAAIWTGAEIEALNFAVAVGSHQGDLIPGTGGLRKLRWARSGVGRRGQARRRKRDYICNRQPGKSLAVMRVRRNRVVLATRAIGHGIVPAPLVIRSCAARQPRR